MSNDGHHNYDPAREVGGRWRLTEADPHPSDGKRRLQRVDQRVLSGRNHLTTDRQDHQPQAELRRPVAAASGRSCARQQMGAGK
jgi:hypothetical protein